MLSNEARRHRDGDRRPSRVSALRTVESVKVTGYQCTSLTFGPPPI